jgi:hypothetical protein
VLPLLFIQPLYISIGFDSYFFKQNCTKISEKTHVKKHVFVLSRRFITSWGMKWYLIEIMVIFVPESTVFIIIFVITTTTITTYICICLAIIRITTITLTSPIYFGIRVTMLSYINIWILTNFTERTQVVTQLFTDLFTVQCMPTGISLPRKNERTPHKICYEVHKSITRNGWLTPLLRRRFEWYTDIVCFPQTASSLYITFIKHVVDSVWHRTRTWNFSGRSGLT